VMGLSPLDSTNKKLENCIFKNPPPPHIFMARCAGINLLFSLCMFIFLLCIREAVVTRWLAVMERKQVVRVATLFNPILVETF